MAFFIFDRRGVSGDPLILSFLHQTTIIVYILFFCILYMFELLEHRTPVTKNRYFLYEGFFKIIF